jgi:serine/threonine protein kinase
MDIEDKQEESETSDDLSISIEDLEVEARDYEKPHLPFEEISGRYKFIRFIALGACANVFKGYDKKLSHPVAIKILPRNLAEKEDYVERFIMEAKVAARLRHPNIIRIYDVGEQEGVYYIIMDFLPGHDLRTRLSLEAIFPHDKIVEIIRDMCSALDYAHAQGVIHRDIKPGNIMFDKYERAVLVDFGIAKAAVEARITQTGTILGSPIYMSPEQFMEESITPASDIYSLGVIFYELLSGKPPFEGNTIEEIKEQHLNSLPPTIDGIEPYLSSVINKCLAKKPENRFKSAQEILDAILNKRIIDNREEKTSVTVKKQVVSGSRLPYPIVLTILSLLIVILVLLLLINGSISLPFVPGTLTIDASPPTAKYIIIGNSIIKEGRGGKSKMSLSSGSYLVKIEQNGFYPASRRIEIRSAKEIDLKTNLIPMGSIKHPLTGENLIWLPYENEDLTANGCWLSTKEVIVKEYALFLNQVGNRIEGGVSYIDIYNPSCLLEIKNGKFTAKTDRGNYPVNLVSYYGAKAYATWSKGYLPREIEFLSACRFGNKENALYPWGDYPSTDLSSNIDYNGKHIPLTENDRNPSGLMPVGSFTPTGLGFFDLAGNLSEWCSYDNGEDLDMQPVRGGSFKDKIVLQACDARLKIAANTRSSSIGFRVAYPPDILERVK